jgi:aquaporin Z
MRNFLVEFLGTFFLVFTVGMSGGNALAIGSVLMVMIYIGGHLSGGHYNPAVTIAVWLRGRLPLSSVLPYIAAQISGGMGAALAHLYFKNSHFGPAPQVDALDAMFLEALFTFALCMVVLSVATTDRLKGNQIYGLAIGFTVLVGVLCIGPMTGAALNPAVATGPALLYSALEGASLASLWIYWAGPVLGGVLSAILYRFLYKLSPLVKTGV